MNAKQDLLLPVKRVNLLVTGCNLACPMCSMNANSKDTPQVLRDYPGASNKRMTLDDFKATFDELENDQPSVSIAGGEPFAFYQMTELIEFLRFEKNLQTSVTTNATLFKADTLKRLAKTGVNFTISIDGLEGIHNHIRGKGVFEKATGNLKKLVEMKKEGYPVGFIASLFALHQSNWHQAEEVAEFLLNEIGIDGLTISFLIFTTSETLAQHKQWVSDHNLGEKYEINIPHGGVDDKFDLQMDYEKIWETKEMLKHRYPQIRYEPDFESLNDLKDYFLTNKVQENYFGTSCNPSRTTMTLLSNGDILFYPGCFEIKMGNVLQSSPREIWNGKEYREIRSLLSQDLSPVCSHCCANRCSKKIIS